MNEVSRSLLPDLVLASDSRPPQKPSFVSTVRTSVISLVNVKFSRFEHGLLLAVLVALVTAGALCVLAWYELTSCTKTCSSVPVAYIAGANSNTRNLQCERPATLLGRYANVNAVYSVTWRIVTSIGILIVVLLTRVKVLFHYCFNDQRQIQRSTSHLVRFCMTCCHCIVHAAPGHCQWMTFGRKCWACPGVHSSITPCCGQA